MGPVGQDIVRLTRGDTSVAGSEADSLKAKTALPTFCA